MPSIQEALRGVKDATDCDVEEIVRVLSAGGYSADDDATGSFLQLDVGDLTGMQLKHRNIIKAAQGGAGRVGREARGEEADLQEVELTLDEDGVCTKMKTMLSNGKLYLDGLEKSLAGSKLVVLTVDGIRGIPVDEHGYTSRTFRANENITLGVARKPDDDARDENLKLSKAAKTWPMWAVDVSSLTTCVMLVVGLLNWFKQAKTDSSAANSGTLGDLLNWFKQGKTNSTAANSSTLGDMLIRNLTDSIAGNSTSGNGTSGGP